MSSCGGPGRFGNCVIRALACSVFAKKYNLKISYHLQDKISELGDNVLFHGDKIHERTVDINDHSYMNFFNKGNVNIKGKGFLQTKEISKLIHEYLISNEVMNSVKSKNKYSSRYNNNNDCFIHIRLGDVSKYTPGFSYYDDILSKLDVDNIYITTDSMYHDIVKKLLNKYSNAQLRYTNDLTDTFHFGSTCKHVILSYGTFSAVLGYLSFHSHVYCLRYCKKYAWDWRDNGQFQMFTDKYSSVGPWEVCG